MNTCHNIRRNTRAERYQYIAQRQLEEFVIEQQNKRIQEEEELKRKKKAEEEELRLKQIEKGERFEISLDSSDTLVGFRLTDTSEIYLALINMYSHDCQYEYNCDHEYYLDKSKVRNIIDQLTQLYDQMTDPKPKDSD
jgi:hypothetical protein